MPIFRTKEEKQFLLICWPFGQVVKNPTIPTFQTLNTPIFHSDRESNKRMWFICKQMPLIICFEGTPYPFKQEEKGGGTIEEANNLKSCILSSPTHVVLEVGWSTQLIHPMERNWRNVPGLRLSSKQREIFCVPLFQKVKVFHGCFWVYPPPTPSPILFDHPDSQFPLSRSFPRFIQHFQSHSFI